jgi:ketosteroid isomerase-like protein
MRDRLELVRGLYGFNWAEIASREDGLEALAAAFSDDFKYYVAPLDRTLRGLGEVAAYLAAIEEDFRELRQEAEEFMAGTEHVVVLGRLSGKGRVSGVPFQTPFGHIWSFRDDKATRLDGYLDPDRGMLLAAVGPRAPGTLAETKDGWQPAPGTIA